MVYYYKIDFIHTSLNVPFKTLHLGVSIYPKQTDDPNGILLIKIYLFHVKTLNFFPINHLV